MEKENRSFIFFHGFCSVCIFHMKSSQKRTEPVQFHQKQRNMMQMEPVSGHITHLPFHRLKTTVRNQAFHLRWKCMSWCHQHRSCTHGLSVQVNRKLLFVSFSHIYCPLLHIPLFLCSKSNIVSLAVTAAAMLYKQDIALMLMQIFRHKRQRAKPAATISMT